MKNLKCVVFLLFACTTLGKVYAQYVPPRKSSSEAKSDYEKSHYPPTDYSHGSYSPKNNNSSKNGSTNTYGSAGGGFNKFKVDVSLGYANPQGTALRSAGLFAVEPKYAVVPQLWLGIRLELAFSGDKTDNLSSGKANTSYLLTSDYYFTDDKLSPFIGIGAGRYSGNVLPANPRFGFMARGGVEFGHVRTGVEYNFLPNKCCDSFSV